jgi:hypothetical protein
MCTSFRVVACRFLTVHQYVAVAAPTHPIRPWTACPDGGVRHSDVE